MLAALTEERPSRIVACLSVISLIATGLFGLTGCARSGGSSTQPVALAKCRAELINIPGVETVLRLGPEGEEIQEGLPFEGLLLALTINGTIQPAGKGEEDDDDWCPAGGERSLDKLIAAARETGTASTVCFSAGKFADARLQEKWLRAGNQLGNLTFSRLKAVYNTTEDFIADIDRNDEVLALLWRKFPAKKKYFRYPRIKVSGDPEMRAWIAEHLRNKGYTTVPATIDARDWRFGQIYCSAMARGDNSCVQFAEQCFFSYLRDTTGKARAVARELTGREAKHILMVEANQFTAENLGKIITWYKRLGAKFVDLEDALGDSLYAERGPDLDPLALTVVRKVKRMRARDDDE